MEKRVPSGEAVGPMGSESELGSASSFDHLMIGEAEKWHQMFRSLKMTSGSSLRVPLSKFSHAWPPASIAVHRAKSSGAVADTSRPYKWRGSCLGVWACPSLNCGFLGRPKKGGSSPAAECRICQQPLQLVSCPGFFAITRAQHAEELTIATVIACGDHPEPPRIRLTQKEKETLDSNVKAGTNTPKKERGPAAIANPALHHTRVFRSSQKINQAALLDQIGQLGELHMLKDERSYLIRHPLEPPGSTPLPRCQSMTPAWVPRRRRRKDRLRSSSPRPRPNSPRFHKPSQASLLHRGIGSSASVGGRIAVRGTAASTQRCWCTPKRGTRHSRSAFSTFSWQSGTRMPR